jgi:hypothetical protein
MADRTQLSESSILALVFQNKVSPQIQRAQIGFQLLPKRPLDPGQQNVTWDIKTGSAGSTGTAPIADGAAATNIGVSTLGKASLPLVTYHKGFSVTRLATFLARWSGNPAELSNIKMFELDDASQVLGYDMAGDTLTGDGYGDGVNIPASGFLAPDPSDANKHTGAFLDTGTYAGVARGSVAQWKGNPLNAKTEGGGALTLPLMRKMISKIVSRDPLSRRPTVILASTLCYDQFVGIFDAQRRYDIDVLRTAGGNEIRLDAGTEVATFDGIPVIRDTRIPETTTGTLLFWNLDELAIRYVPMPSAEDYEQGNVTASPISNTIGSGNMSTSTGIMGEIIKLGMVGNKETYVIYTYWQAQCETPASCGYIYNISLS